MSYANRQPPACLNCSGKLSSRKGAGQFALESTRLKRAKPFRPESKKVQFLRPDRFFVLPIRYLLIRTELCTSGQFFAVPVGTLYFRSVLRRSDRNFVLPVSPSQIRSELRISDQFFADPVGTSYFRSVLCRSERNFVLPISSLQFRSERRDSG